MIVRVWGATASTQNAPAYRAHLENSVFPLLRSLEGFVEARLLQRRAPGGDNVEFLVETCWASMTAVRAFAGDAFENAVIAPAARSLLTSFDDMVSHYEVTAELKP